MNQNEFRVRYVVALMAAIAFSWASICASPSLAQDEARVKAGLEAWKGAGCAECHGAFADGEKERDEAPTGADIRRARLTPDELKLTIRCGRPGGMPAFDDGGSGCTGETGDYPAPVKLNAEQIDNVIAYLQARIIGKGRITKQECLYYYDNKEDWCQDYN